MKTLLLAGLMAFSLIIPGYAVQSPLTSGQDVAILAQHNPMLLSVAPLKQSKATSCGEAVVAMAYNYAYPLAPLEEAAVIDYAAKNGYYTSGAPPFTSPAAMVNIAAHYVKDYEAGNVDTPAEGLSLLYNRLQAGQPVMIDVLTRLNDKDSGAHFVLVTGMEVDPARNNALTIYYNNPLNGKSKSAAWGGSAGIWNAWKNNGDPGGSGWWLVITPK